MKNLQIFSNPQFGEIRMVEINGQPYAVGSDVAKALGYVNPSKALNDHCKGITKRYIPTEGGKQKMNVIPEGDLYRLIVHSQLPAAVQFERWIFDEVLPTIRKTGEYKTRNARPHSLTEINNAAKLITGLCEKAGVAPQFQLIAAKSIYASIGIDVSVEGVTVRQQLFEPTEIARKLGIFSNSGKPHAQAVSAIIAKLPIEKGEREPVPYSASHGHYGTHYQFSESVIDKVIWWLEKFDYPAQIDHKDRKYAVTYSGKQQGGSGRDARNT